MKQLILTPLILFCIATASFAQKRNTVELNLSAQPSSKLHFRLLYDKATSDYNGQAYSFFCQNISGERIRRIEFDLVAYTTCGTEVKEHMDFALDANETAGGGNFMNSTYVGSVTPTECKGETVSYTLNGIAYKGINRIKSLGIKNLLINHTGANTVTSANANTGVKSDDTTQGDVKPAANTVSQQASVKPPVVTPPVKTTTSSPGMQQLQQTKAYADSHVGLPQTQSVAQSIQNFGNALSNYQASRQREQENRENRRIAANNDAFDFINCLSGKAFEDYYVEKYSPWVCGYGKIGSERTTTWQGAGKIDSVNYFYKQKKYLEGAIYISNENLRNKLADCNECSTFIFRNLRAGNVVSEIEGLYVYTSYMNIYNYDYKQRAELKKDLSKGEYSGRQLLGAGISSLFDKKDTTFAAFCFSELLRTNTPKYFKKSAYLYLGIIKKAQAISTQNNALLNEAIALLDKGYAISESQFLKIGSSYSDGKYTDNYSGLFVYPEYNRLLQVALLQEITNALYYKYKMVNNTAFLRLAFKYYYGFVDAVTNNPDAVYTENTFNEKDFKKIAGLYNKAKKLEKDGKKTEAFALYKEAAEMGDSDSQFSVGDAYEEGEGVEKNMQEAMKWYQKAAIQGESISQFALATNNYFGVDGVKNLQEAITWGLRSANQGNKGSQYFIAIMYENGEGVPKDTDEALLWFIRAAGQGHPKAKTALDKLTEQTR